MKTKFDVRIKYQKDSGLSLASIDSIADDRPKGYMPCPIECPNCGESWEEEIQMAANTDVQEYIEWLEMQLALTMEDKTIP